MDCWLPYAKVSARSYASAHTSWAQTAAPKRPDSDLK